MHRMIWTSGPGAAPAPRKLGDSRKTRHSTHLGRHAQAVQASRTGDYYTYCVEEFWIVQDVFANGRLILETPGSKTHEVERSDPNLRRAPLWNRI